MVARVSEWGLRGGGGVEWEKGSRYLDAAAADQQTRAEEMWSTWNGTRSVNRGPSSPIERRKRVVIFKRKNTIYWIFPSAILKNCDWGFLLLLFTTWHLGNIFDSGYMNRFCPYIIRNEHFPSFV